jgi:molybdenum cofactor guanylyltransferase
MTSPSIAALVLAGGEARRMGGGDKPLTRLAGRPMLAWVMDSLNIPNTAISANGDPARFAGFNCPVLADGAFAGQGPLAGLLAGLEWAATLGAEVLLTAPGDTPFLPQGLASHLAPAPSAARSNGRNHHLVALWPVSAAGLLRQRLSSPGQQRVSHFASQIGMRYVEFVVRSHDPFANINTNEEMEKARMEADLDPLIFGNRQYWVGKP